MHQHFVTIACEKSSFSDEENSLGIPESEEKE